MIAMHLKRTEPFCREPLRDRNSVPGKVQGTCMKTGARRLDAGGRENI